MKRKNVRNELSKNIKNSMSGITLIALIITIIVLLILAGVTLSSILGENGILTRAENSVARYKEAENDERITLGTYADEIDRYSGGVTKVTDEEPGDLTNGDETSGTELNPYEISSIEDFIKFIYMSRELHSFENEFVQLTSDLDFSSINSYMDPNTTVFGDFNEDGEEEGLFNELNKGKGLRNAYNFYGTFDGNGYTLKNFYMQDELYNCFENTDYTDLTIGLIEENYGIIKNLNITGTINVILKDEIKKAYVGSIVAMNRENAQVINCTSNVNINCTSENLQAINTEAILVLGGLTGRNEGTLNKCIYNGNINANYEILSNVDASLEVRFETGGISGDNYCSIINCINNGDVDVEYNFSSTISAEGLRLGVGGITAKNCLESSIENCVNTGNISAVSENTNIRIGGIVASVDTDINCLLTNVYNSGTIKANTTKQLEIAGIEAEDYGTVKYAYNIGSIINEGTTTDYIGAIAGNEHSESGVITNSYYNKVDGLYGVQGYDEEGITAVEGLTQETVIGYLNTNVTTNNADSANNIWYQFKSTSDGISFLK